MKNKKFTKQKNSLFLQAAVIGLFVIGLIAAVILVQRPSLLFPSAASLSGLSVNPKSGNWNFPNKFLVKNTSNNSITFNYLLDCWNTEYCQDQTGTKTLSAGETVELGLGEICAKWQLDIDRNRDGSYEWGAVAELSEDKCGGTCKIGYAYTRELFSTNYANSVIYLRDSEVTSAMPDNAELVTFDLWRNTLQANSLDDIEALVITAGPQPNNARGPLRTADRFTSSELNLIQAAYNRGVPVIMAGDNLSSSTSINDGGAEVAQVTNRLQNIVSYQNSVLYVPERTWTQTQPSWGPSVPLIPSVTMDTRGSLDDPGVVRLVSPPNLGTSSCLGQVRTASSGASCLAFYMPPSSSGSGFLYLDANAGVTLDRTPNLFANLLAEACK